MIKAAETGQSDLDYLEHSTDEPTVTHTVSNRLLLFEGIQHQYHSVDTKKAFSGISNFEMEM